MGLGKTVMTIALILSRPGRNSPDNPEQDDAVNTEVTKKRKQDCNTEAPFKPKGGTLIVCPMALLSQLKVNHTSLILNSLHTNFLAFNYIGIFFRLNVGYYLAEEIFSTFYIL